MNHYILGISAFYHDSAAALLKDGEIVAAAQEERFSRIKQDNRFPANAIKFCLREANISLKDIDAVFYYENPQKKLSRIISTYYNFGLKSYTSFIDELPEWLTKKIRVKHSLNKALRALSNENESIPKIHYVDHHESHAASAFYASPYEKAAILCIDGVGEWSTTTAWVGDGNQLELLWEIKFPHSLGLLYSAFTYFCGFKVDSGEYKLMGLAPYGKPKYYKKIMEHLVDVKSDGSFWLNMDYFDYATGNSMISDQFASLFDGPRREPESLITTREFDLAASIQMVLEEIVLQLARTVQRETQLPNLCMAGGVALNCVSNGKLLRENIFKEIWVQPAAGDCGGAIGAALTGWHKVLNKPRNISTKDFMRGTFLGSAYEASTIMNELDKFNAKYTVLSDSELAPKVAELLEQGQVIGWFQGRMEFGPRALGARSILGDPRNPNMQSKINLKIKNRESFRPFAPAVLEEFAHEWFELNHTSPYMLFVMPVHKNQCFALTKENENLQGIEKLKVARSTIPAVTHVDYSARIQTVNRDTNPLFYDLIYSFYQLTHCPVIVNTSFNVRGEPMVESPRDAYTCFMRTQMDYLVIGPYLLRKDEQPIWNEKENWRVTYQLD